MIFEELYESILEEHRQVFQRIDLEMVRAFMDQIIRARRIHLLGGGREGLATRAFAMRLMHMGKEAHWVWDDTAPNVAPGDLFIITSGPGEVGHTHWVTEQAKKAGATIAVITGSKVGRTVDLADTILFVPAHVYKGTDEYNVPSKQPMGNLFEQSLVLLLDMIVILLMEEMNISEEEMISRHRNVE